METYELLDVEDIVELHDMLIRDFGGMEGIYPETEGKVEAILNNMFAEYFGNNPYDGLFNKAAYLLYSLTKNHCFPDGNKRIAFNSCEIFLYINGYELNTERIDFAKFVESVASSRCSSKNINTYILSIGKTLKNNCIYLEEDY